MELREKEIGISQKAVIYREDGKILALRRTASAPSRPLYWDLPGGQLEFGEEPKEDIEREIKEEAGIDVKDLKFLDVFATFNDRKQFWLTIGYRAKAVKDEIKLSFEHDDFRWITPDEFLKLKASPKNKQFVEAFKKCHGA